MKRTLLLICITVILLAVIPLPAGGFADGDHPITMTVTVDPDPELEEGGTVPDLLFTIRNNGTSDYTLEDATLTGGFEEQELTLDEHRITVLAGGTKEFHLKDVQVSDEQLDTETVYTLSWKETVTSYNEETDLSSTVVYTRETSASVIIPRFVPPELTVSAHSNVERVREGETFTVVYTVQNDTKYDMSGLKLYDPEQSMQRIELPSADLYAGEQCSVEITYTMGKTDMEFCPAIEYVVRQREMETHAKKTLSIESIIVEMTIDVQQYPTTQEGASFAITIYNAGNRTVTNIRLFDEINTPIGDAFDLAPEQSKALTFTVPSAVASGVIRIVSFHLTAVDCFGKTFTVSDPNQYEAKPYVASDAVKLYLYVELQRAYYDDNGKLCGMIQFEIRNFSDVVLHNAVLTEKNLFGRIAEYRELPVGTTYRSESYQLDGVASLSFSIRATDPAGNEYQTGEVELDLSNLKAYVEQQNEPVYVYPYNPYLKNLAERIQKPARTALIVVLSVVFVCLLACIILYAAERRLKAKLPPAFEEDMERALNQTKRRQDSPLFKDAPTERFGYRVPIKLRDYGELTEEEAEARRQEYQRKLQESIERDTQPKPIGAPQNAKPAAQKPQIPEKPQPNERAEEPTQQTRIIPIRRERPAPQPPVAKPIAGPIAAATPAVPVAKPIEKDITATKAVPAVKPVEEDIAATKAVPVIKTIEPPAAPTEPVEPIAAPIPVIVPGPAVAEESIEIRGPEPILKPKPISKPEPAVKEAAPVEPESATVETAQVEPEQAETPLIRPLLPNFMDPAAPQPKEPEPATEAPDALPQKPSRGPRSPEIVPLPARRPIERQPMLHVNG